MTYSSSEHCEFFRDVLRYSILQVGHVYDALLLNRLNFTLLKVGGETTNLITIISSTGACHEIHFQLSSEFRVRKVNFELKK